MDHKLAGALVIWALGVACLALAFFGGSNLAPRRYADDGRFHFDVWLYRTAPRLYIALQRVEFVFGALVLGAVGYVMWKYGR